jgi:dihydrofolate synthase/folylpolyglutamate synthase
MLRNPHAPAVGAVEALSFIGVEIPPEAIVRGLRQVWWPGRLEVVGRSPMIVLDGAKDPEAAVEAVRQAFTPRRIVTVISISSDKNIPVMMGQFAQVASYFITIRHRIAGRAVDPEVIAEEARRLHKPCEVVPDVGAALRRAGELAGRDDMILVIGSVFLVGEARENLLSPLAF